MAEQDGTLGNGTLACNAHDGRLQCPLEFPWMCAQVERGGCARHLGPIRLRPDSAQSESRVPLPGRDEEPRGRVHVLSWEAELERMVVCRLRAAPRQGKASCTGGHGRAE
jgi:hypothetical protein